jgi:hypothetical protein
MTSIVVFHGDPEEAYQLVIAVQHNCECVRNAAGAVDKPCASHRAMTDQRWLDTILFMRWLVQRELLTENMRKEEHLLIRR